MKASETRNAAGQHASYSHSAGSSGLPTKANWPRSECRALRTSATRPSERSASRTTFVSGR
ncbi:hypothetical protein ACGFX2_38965 [Streptomyces goshikiensis]|uniref:hypothetical protein n=1 Tax=Streptomyces goshikiensis TaxID=1942 RepID=UPI0037114050